MTKALVIGGGGITGMAWEAGILAGLMEKGIQLNHADTVLGTSAGSFISALLLNNYDMKAYYQYLSQHKDENDTAELTPDLYKRWVAAVVDGGDDQIKVGKMFGQIAEDFKPTISPEQRKAAVKVRLRDSEWQPQLNVTALDIETGQLNIFSEKDGISLMDAVMASGAVPGIWPYVEYNGRKYMDGGFVNSANTLAVSSAEEIIVIAPLDQKQGQLPSVHEDVAQLKQTKQVTLITPNQASRSIIGTNIYDNTKLEAIGDEGYKQGLLIADQISNAWKS